jgi:hypothetical protein
MALSDTAIRAAKPARTQFKLYDEGGLFLIVRPSGGKLWRLKYRHLGKEQALSLGRYPAVGLKEARAARDEARKLIASGKNPAFEKKRAAVAASVGAANTFAAIAEELIAKREREGLKAVTTGKARWLIEVKSTISSPLRFILTRGEWERAKDGGPAYHFHIWDMQKVPPILYQRTVLQVAAHIPSDNEKGKWKTAEIPLG